MVVKKKIIVACTNTKNEADLFVCTVEVSEAGYIDGVHYELAEEAARKAGYAAPYICFDESDQKNIASKVSELDCPVPFTLFDKASDDEVSVPGKLLFGWDGISVNLDGYSDCSSADNHGVVAYLEYWDGSANLRAYSDINSEEPTNNISLEGARNECRHTSVSLIDAEYVSEWEEGDIYSFCQIDEDNLAVTNIEVKDCDFQHLIAERIDITLNGRLIQFDAEDGELTLEGKSKLKQLLIA
mgnify:CR=1 FL=1